MRETTYFTFDMVFTVDTTHTNQVEVYETVWPIVDAVLEVYIGIMDEWIDGYMDGWMY